MNKRQQDMAKKQKEIIWTFRVKFPGGSSECVRIIEIKSNASFFELHETIQEAVNFDNDHLFEFYIGRNPRNKFYVIGEEPEWNTPDPIEQYNDIQLSSVWPLPKGMTVYYRFDFGDNWLFQINKTQHKDKIVQPDVVYPRIIEAKGENPEQYSNYEEWED